MSKPLIPSRTLLSSFARSLGRHYTAPAQRCLRATRFSSTTSTRVAFPRTHQAPLPRLQCRTYKTVQEARSRHSSGPFSTLAGVLFLGSGAGLIFYFRYEKERMERKRVAEAAKGVGKPKVGGDFDLIDQKGEPWSSERMKGGYSLVGASFSLGTVRGRASR